MPVINLFIEIIILNLIETTHSVESIKSWGARWAEGPWLSAIESASLENWTKISR